MQSNSWEELQDSEQQIFLNFILEYQQQIQYLKFEQTVKILLDIHRFQAQQQPQEIIRFNSTRTLVITDRFCHSYLFQFFRLFNSNNLSTLRIENHLLHTNELNIIAKYCQNLKHLQLTIINSTACAKLSCNSLLYTRCMQFYAYFQ